MAKPALSRFAGFNITAPGVDTNVPNVGVKPGPAALLRITIALTTSSVVNLSVTDGSTTHVWGLNSSTALNAADLYVFELGAMHGLTYDVQVETDGVIEILLIDEILGAG